MKKVELNSVKDARSSILFKKVWCYGNSHSVELIKNYPEVDLLRHVNLHANVLIDKVPCRIHLKRGYNLDTGNFEESLIIQAKDGRVILVDKQNDGAGPGALAKMSKREFSPIAKFICKQLEQRDGVRIDASDYGSKYDKIIN